MLKLAWQPLTQRVRSSRKPVKIYIETEYYILIFMKWKLTRLKMWASWDEIQATQPGWLPKWPQAADWQKTTRSQSRNPPATLHIIKTRNVAILYPSGKWYILSKCHLNVTWQVTTQHFFTILGISTDILRKRRRRFDDAQQLVNTTRSWQSTFDDIIPNCHDVKNLKIDVLSKDVRNCTVWLTTL